MLIPQHVYVSARAFILFFLWKVLKNLWLSLLSIWSPPLFVFFIFPAHTKPARAPSKSYPRGVVFEDVTSIDIEEDDDQPNATVSLNKKSVWASLVSLNAFLLFHIRRVSSEASLFHFLCRNPSESRSENPQEDDDKEVEEKINKLQEMFPQLARTELLEVRQ